MSVNWAFFNLFYCIITCRNHYTCHKWTGWGGGRYIYIYTHTPASCLHRQQKSLLACSFVSHVQKKNWYIPNGSVFPFPVLMTKVVLFDMFVHTMYTSLLMCVLGSGECYVKLKSSSTYCWCIITQTSFDCQLCQYSFTSNFVVDCLKCVGCT